MGNPNHRDFTNGFGFDFSGFGYPPHQWLQSLSAPKNQLELYPSWIIDTNLSNYTIHLFIWWIKIIQQIEKL